MRQYLKSIRRLVKRILNPEPRKPAIILLGNSQIEMGNWPQLLGRADLINRGIGGDTLGQILRRAKRIRHTTAKIVFIEGGINDIPANKDIDLLFKQYQEIISLWQVRQLKVVVIGLVYVSPLAAQVYPTRSNWQQDNQLVAKLNEKLRVFCRNKNIDFLDLNALLSDSIQLQEQYTTDGLHFTESGYQIWAEAIHKILQLHQL